MKRFFSKTGHSLTTKNKLEAEVLEHIKSRDRWIIRTENLESYIASINEKIDAINKKHPRCKPVEPRWWQPYDAGTDSRGDWYLNLHFVSLHLYEEA